MKKKVFCLTLVAFLICPVFATDINQLLTLAKANGSVFSAVENSYISKTNIQSMGKTASAVSVKVTQSEPITDFFSDVPDASLVVNMPEFVDGLSIATAFNSNSIKLPMGKNQYIMSIAPSVNYSKNIDLVSSEYKDALEDNTALENWISYKKGMLQAENGFIDSIITIMQTKAQIEKSEKSLERSKLDYENSLKIGQIQEGSVNDMKTKSQLESAQTSLKSSKVQMEALLRNFKNSYGIDFEEVTEVYDYSIEFDSDLVSNYDLDKAYKQMLKAENDYNKAVGKDSSIALSGQVTSPVSFKDGKYDSFGMTMSGNASVYTGNLKLGVKIETSLKDKKMTEPVLTIEGSWGKSKASDANADNKLISYRTAITAYENAVNSFNNSLLSLKNDIASFESEVQQLQIRKNYNEMILEYQTELFEMGYISESEYQDALEAVENDIRDGIILSLKGLKLENQIKIFSF